MQPLGNFDTPRESATATIDTTGWAKGRHTIFVQGADTAGNVGPVTAVSVEIGQSVYVPYIANEAATGAQGRAFSAGLDARGRVKE